ncbi:hypothetical protein [Candidatus Sororendozoicomonas aggregata]|uniref:hypothetical protein n=1 Tax=Candidatus Sororendozoicomonas aggregata TaxID=3073239 RepID=UPI002ED1B81B
MDDAVADDCCTQSHLMVNALLKYTSFYVLIVVHNTDVAIAGTHYSGTGHALCAWLGNRQSDAVFFDPNEGEVWFEHRREFAKFSRDYFADLMLQQQWAEWELYPLAKPEPVQGFEMVSHPTRKLP